VLKTLFESGTLSLAIDARALFLNHGGSLLPLSIIEFSVTVALVFLTFMLICDADITDGLGAWWHAGLGATFL
jgi:hypothetical protein